MSRKNRGALKVASAALAGAAVGAIATYLLVPRLPVPVTPAGGIVSKVGSDSRFQDVSDAIGKDATRPIAGRSTLGLAYAPPPPEWSGKPKPSALSPQLESALRAAVVREGATPADRLRAQRELAILVLIAGRHDEAIGILTLAAAEHPNDPAILSDLAAAHLEKAAKAGSRSDLSEAFGAVTRSLARDPDLIEARFNHALILESLGDTALAKEAWGEYRRRNPAGPWSEEAARHQKAADAAPPPPKKQQVVFESVVDFGNLVRPSVGAIYRPFVSGGKESRDYPASFYSLSTKCTATLIGPSVILTGAHCLSYPANGTERIALKNHLTGFEAECDIAPGYNPLGPRGNRIQDWALCKTLSPQVLRAEVVSTDKRLTRQGEPVTITGYGCDYVHGIGGYGHAFTVGVTKIEDASFLGTDLIRTKSVDRVSLCPGDSGGGTFSMIGTDRVQIAVNSASNFFANVSTMSNLASDAGIEFLHEWSKCRKVKICGVDPQTPGCRFSKMPGGNVKRKPLTKPCRAEWKT